MTKIWWNGNRIDAPEGWNPKDYAGVYVTSDFVPQYADSFEIKVGKRLAVLVSMNDVTILEPRKYPAPSLPN